MLFVPSGCVLLFRMMRTCRQRPQIEAAPARKLFQRMPKDMQIIKPPAELAAEWAALGPHLLVVGKRLCPPPDWPAAGSCS